MKSPVFIGACVWAPFLFAPHSAFAQEAQPPQPLPPIAPIEAGATQPSAQDPVDSRSPIVVSVDASASGLISPDATRTAVASELRAPVVEPGAVGAQSPRGTLTIAAGPDGRLFVAYRDIRGREVFRVIALPGDPVAAVATVALLAGSLARSDADELLGQLSPPAVTPPAPVPPPAIPVPQSTIAPPRFLVDERSPSQLHPFAIGFEAFSSAVPSRPNSFDAVIFGGLSLSYSPFRHVGFGIDTLMVNALPAAQGSRFAVSGGVHTELFTFVGSWLQPYATLGSIVQGRWGGGVAESIGVIPVAGAGVRVWIARRVSIGLGVRGLYVATGGFAAWPHVLPAGSFLVSGGLDVAVHL